MDNITNTENEIKTWLLVIFKKQNIKDISVKIVGNSEKGDGYIGDIVFVQAFATTKNNQTKKYNLVLKCSKRSQALRENSPVKQAFLNEIFVYKTLLPTFTKFQTEKGIENPFNSVAKCYGTFVGKDMEIIVFENLKESGYDLWAKKKPLTRKHIDMVLQEYAKYHAVSIAMQDQRPKEFQTLVDALEDIFQKFMETGDFYSLFEELIDEVADLLQGELDDLVLKKWKNFKHHTRAVLDTADNTDGLKVILHGDSWNNNFMYKYANGITAPPTAVAILDWQISRLSTPIYDLSYFLFSCISKEDLEEIDIILGDYHKKLSDRVRLLGSDPTELFPLDKFLDDWKKYSKYGIVLASLLMKVVSTDKDEVVDIAQAAEEGKDFAQSFRNEIKDKENVKRRMRPIIEYAVQNGLI